MSFLIKELDKQAKQIDADKEKEEKAQIASGPPTFSNEPPNESGQSPNMFDTLKMYAAKYQNAKKETRHQIA